MLTIRLREEIRKINFWNVFFIFSALNIEKYLTKLYAKSALEKININNENDISSWVSLKEIYASEATDKATCKLLST